MGLSLGHATFWLQQEGDSETANWQDPATPEPRSTSRESMMCREAQMASGVRRLMHSDVVRWVRCAALAAAVGGYHFGTDIAGTRITAQPGEGHNIGS